MRIRFRQQTGSVIIMVVIAMVALLGAVGLATDAGLAYVVKGKLNAATDSAAVAAANAVVVGDTQAEQTANAQRAAQRFFDANFPAGYMGASASMNTPGVTFDGGKITIDITASATMPISLLGVLNLSPLTPGVVSQTVRKDLDMMFVMDVSGSLQPSAAPVRAAAVTFLNKFNNKTDRVGLARFAYGAVVDDPIRTAARGFDRDTMVAHINAAVFDGSTASSEGLWQARAQLNGIPQLKRSSLRVVVFFSDGAPNSFASYFPYKTAADCTTAGTMTTGDGTTPNYPGGLLDPNQLNVSLPPKCTPASGHLSDQITGLPAWYNAHNPAANPNDPALREFPIVTATPRAVTADMSNETIAWTNVNRASRNLVEAMAANLRDQGVFVFTLGLGSEVNTGTGPDKEKGADVLRCMANSTDAPSRCYNPAKPVGLYCPAATTVELTPCFSKLASAILRISK